MLSGASLRLLLGVMVGTCALRWQVAAGRRGTALGMLRMAGAGNGIRSTAGGMIGRGVVCLTTGLRVEGVVL
jgi:hypothetical protein